MDAGCGDGRLLDVIGQSIDANLCGFDSAEYGLQTTDFIGSQMVGADIRRTLPGTYSSKCSGSRAFGRSYRSPS